MEKKLIAPCGINCGTCMAYLRDKNKCVGCRNPDSKKPITRVKCKIKTCEVFKSGKKKFCFECETFPCKNLKHLDKRYREKYNLSLIKNLETIKEIGIKKFMEKEEIKWKCPTCGGTICVHKGYCLECRK